FLNIIDEYRKSAEEYEQELIRRTKHEKNMFLVRNKPWQGLAEDSLENGYIDSRQKLVYLPLGDLSFADSVIDFQPGKPEGRTPENSLGPPEKLEADANTDCATLGLGGTLTLLFEDNAIIDVNGPDIYVFELGAIEPTNLEISKDGQNWIDVGQISGDKAFVDIGNYTEKGEVFHYVRFTALQTDSSQLGANIDAVAVIGGAFRMNLNSAVLFETGSHVLKEEGRLAIQELATTMKSIKKAKITIEGHTDDVGDNASNKILSQKRAASVAQELKKVIANSDHNWKEIGFGESQPIVPNDSDEKRQKNQRVEILVTPF
ncbi:MAG: OmpA family protein, partial [Maribacter sp.]|nr:OmpA family protein [Maribacter sp.]